MNQHPLSNVVSELMKAMKDMKTAFGNNYENMKLFIEQSQCHLKQDLKKDLDDKLTIGFEEQEGRILSALNDLTNIPSSAARPNPFTPAEESNGQRETSNSYHVEPLGPLDLEWLSPLSEEMCKNITDVNRVLSFEIKDGVFSNLLKRIK